MSATFNLKGYFDTLETILREEKDELYSARSEFEHLYSHGKYDMINKSVAGMNKAAQRINLILELQGIMNQYEGKKTLVGDAVTMPMNALLSRILLSQDMTDSTFYARLSRVTMNHLN